MKRKIIPYEMVEVHTLSLPARIVLGLVVISVITVRVHAAVAVSNLGFSEADRVSVSFSEWRPISFTTDATAGYQLESVSLRIGTANNTSGNFFVAVYSDASSLPGSQLELLSGLSNPSSAGDYSFTSGGTTLSANTTYWLVAGVSSGSGSYDWKVTSDTSQTGAWGIGNNRFFSGNQGGSWNIDASPVMFSVSATAIPEPHTFALLAGFAGLGVVLWKRTGRKLDFQGVGAGRGLSVVSVPLEKDSSRCAALARSMERFRRLDPLWYYW